MELANRFMPSGVLFLLTLAFGFWLSHAGKLELALMLTIHHVAAMVLVICFAVVLLCLAVHP